MSVQSKKTFSPEEVASHNKDGDCWVVVDDKIYDVSKFLNFHPGGKHVLVSNSGRDVSEEFKVYHNESVLRKYHDKFYIGDLVDPTRKEKMSMVGMPGTFGDMIPYGDPIWYQRFNSPYYKETHRQWRAKLRNFVDTEVIPTMHEWQDSPRPPADILLKMGEQGFLAAMCGPPWPKEYLPSHITPPEDFDSFHELIAYDEISRCGHGAVIGALTNGPSIALTVVHKFGSDEVKRKVVQDVLLGKKFIALAISEPQAGSDVAGMVTTAKRDGDHYVINGNKKWITNGTYADFFATAVRTGAKGELSFFLVEADTPGFSVRKINIRGSDISGTAYLDFDKCRVPAGNLIGKENKGFKLVMYNFNHERFYVTTIVTRLARICLEESIKYALRRRAFGKRLSDIQAIRMKIAAMARQVESLQTWLEYITYQLCTMSHQEANMKLGDVISLLKAHASKVYEYCARETTMVFGGNALYVDGVGRKIEGAVAQVKGYQIPAGAEDVMDDFAARMAFKTALKYAKI